MSIEAREDMIASGKLPKQGEGPDAAKRARSTFKLLFEAKNKDGSRKLM